LLLLTRRLAREDDLGRLLEQIVDTMLELTGGERGVAIVSAGDANMEVAREFGGADDAVSFSRSVVQRVLEDGVPVLSVDAAADERFDQSKSISHLNLRSVVAVPLSFRGDRLGALYVDHRLRRGAFDEEDLALVEDFADIAAMAVAHARALRLAREQAEALARQSDELSRRLEEREAEVQGLRDEVRAAPERTEYRGMVGSSAAMQELYRLVDRLGGRDVPVLIQGESGTGKELVARALHAAGSRGSSAFVAENCGAIPESLIESVLFGHARGAFTGAVSARPGLFESANGGTIFLDEIGEMPLAMQTKLLRVLQEGEVRRVGENQVRRVDVRIIAASNRDLEALVNEGRFRQDLFYRIHVVRLELPPLRRRREDIMSLVSHFLDRYEAGAMTLSKAAIRRVLLYGWPGNVRELENEVQRWVALCDGRVRIEDLSPGLLPGDAGEDPDDLGLKRRVARLERELISEAMRRAGGNQTAAAELLGLSRYGLAKKIKRQAEQDAATALADETPHVDGVDST
jgi:transcriptional regulator with GAF, ATPase, and Fis domain